MDIVRCKARSSISLVFSLQEAEIVRKALMTRGLGMLGDQHAKIGTARAVPHVDWPAHPGRRSLQLPPRCPGMGAYNDTPGVDNGPAHPGLRPHGLGRVKRKVNNNRSSRDSLRRSGSELHEMAREYGHVWNLIPVANDCHFVRSTVLGRLNSTSRRGGRVPTTRTWKKCN